RSARSGFAPAAEHEPAEREAEPEGAEGEAADRHTLAPRRQALPAPEGVAFLCRQRLAAALLPQGAAGTQAEVEVVEDLRRLLVGHLTHCIACFGGDYAHPARFGSPCGGPGRPRAGACAPRPGRNGRARPRARDRRSDPSRPPGAARARRVAPPLARPA